ncbi:unnamed protein product, partial [Laminaria digitata]
MTGPNRSTAHSVSAARRGVRTSHLTKQFPSRDFDGGGGSGSSAGGPGSTKPEAGAAGVIFGGVEYVASALGRPSIGQKASTGSIGVNGITRRGSFLRKAGMPSVDTGVRSVRAATDAAGVRVEGGGGSSSPILSSSVNLTDPSTKPMESLHLLNRDDGGGVNLGTTLQTVEGREEGAVALRVFGMYFTDAAGGWLLPIVSIIVSVLTQACTNIFDLWLSYWSDQYLVNGT